MKEIQKCCATCRFSSHFGKTPTGKFQKEVFGFCNYDVTKIVWPPLPIAMTKAYQFKLPDYLSKVLPFEGDRCPTYQVREDTAGLPMVKVGRKLITWNVRSFESKGDRGTRTLYLAGYTKKEMIELTKKAGFHYVTLKELNNYGNEGWGRQMDGVQPEPGVWAVFDDRNETPKRLI